jgi:hypothetical protein
VKSSLKLSTFIWLALLLDSGGGLGLRSTAILLMISFIFLSLIQNKTRFTATAVKALILSILLLIVIAISTVVNEIDIFKAFSYSAFSLFLVISLFWASTVDSSEIFDSYVYASLAFMAVYCSLHLFLLFFPEFGQETVRILSSSFSGRFHEKNFYGFGHYVIYPQAVLFISGSAVLLFIRRMYFLYIISLIFLAVSTSRFGFFVAIFFPALLMLFNVRKLSSFLLMSFGFILASLFICYFIIFLIYAGSYTPDYYHGLSSFEARVGHLLSSFYSFSNVYELLVGQGPGSEFFSLRSLSYVDNSELSQLEFFRRLGVFGFTLYHSIVFLSLWYCYTRSRYDSFLLIFSIYFVTISNPVLTSLTVSMLVASGFSLNRNVKSECSNNCSI